MAFMANVGGGHSVNTMMKAIENVMTHGPCNDAWIRCQERFAGVYGLGRAVAREAAIDCLPDGGVVSVPAACPGFCSGTGGARGGASCPGGIIVSPAAQLPRACAPRDGAQVSDAVRSG